MYPNKIYHASHPENLHLVGRMYGLSPPDYRTANILELGCGLGGNALGIAAKYPECHVTAVDISADYIRVADENRKVSGCSNLIYLCQSLEKVEGEYDYVIAHGVFSWVGEHLRSKILEICAKSHISYISYNTLPGWYDAQVIRDMRMLIDGGTPVSQAGSLLKILGEISAISPWLDAEIDLIIGNELTWFIDDHLAPESRPFYFNDFMRMAQSHGLHYAGDASQKKRENWDLWFFLRDKLDGDVLDLEQYLDFAVKRRFRKTILSREQPTPPEKARVEDILR